MIFQERTYSVLVVSSAGPFHKALSELLPMTDFWPVTVAKSAGEARRMLLGQPRDLILINTPLPDDFGMRLAMDLCGNSQSGVLLFVQRESYEEICAKVTPYGVLTIPKPTSVQTVKQYLRVLCATRERLRRLEEKQSSVEEKMEEIRLVNRAKWLLIEHLHMTEAQAHRYLEKKSMDTRLSRREVAQTVIRDYESPKAAGPNPKGEER